MKKILLSLAAASASLSLGATDYTSQRPAKENRLFSSEVIENKIVEVQSQLKNPYLRWMFGNCYSNTLDTTVHFGKDENGNFRTFVYTGDIHAMWLRDSGAQVWPYVRFANEDEHLRQMLEGVIRCQISLICIDPYANAYNDGPTGSEWESDFTEMNHYIHERKWEIDSQCYPIRLAYQYWKVTGDDSIFDATWKEAIGKILTVMKEQQRKNGLGSYSFMRETERQLDTKCCMGYGNPVKPVGLIVSSFRPSDDATTFDFLIPSNFFAVTSLRKAAEILETVNKDKKTAKECRALADEVEAAIKKYAVGEHPEFGKIMRSRWMAWATGSLWMMPMCLAFWHSHTLVTCPLMTLSGRIPGSSSGAAATRISSRARPVRVSAVLMWAMTWFGR